MTLDRARCVTAFRRAVDACDPARLVAGALASALGPLADRPRFGVAIGKAALAMARGAGPVERGVIVTHADDGRGAPPGWYIVVGAHPVPDARSLHAGEAVIDLVAGARADGVVLALVSGGASALVERPAPGVAFDELRARVADLMASGADIHAINRLRGELSALKGGKLARLCTPPVATLAISDVHDNDIAVIGSGPTIAPERPRDRARVIASMQRFATELAAAYRESHDHVVGPFPHPITSNVHAAAEYLLARELEARPRVYAAWGEPTVALPEPHGEGGRAQQLALILARELRGGHAAAFIAASDGADGPAPRLRPAPAGAFVDETTWARVRSTGIDPDVALATCDAGAALHAVGALVATGPTGINHGDVMLIG